MIATKRETWLLRGFVAVIAIAFGLLIWRLVYLQIIHQEVYAQSSQRQQSAMVPEQPRRGLILDGRGRILAASVKTYNAFIEPRRVLNSVEGTQIVASELQDILDFPGHEICRLVEESRNPGYVKISETITPEQRRALNQARLTGVGIETDWQRYYPAGNLTGHVLGFVGAENKGLAGVELKYNTPLAGEEGEHVFVVDALRRPIGQQPAESKDAKDGYNLVLTIDSVIQRFVHEAIDKQIKEYEAESGVGVVMDPWTGAVLAMVSIPDYQPEEFSTSTQDQMRNRVLTDPYEPGSIFKPIVTAIGLEFGKIGYNDKFDCENGYWSSYSGIGEFNNKQYGILSVKEILINSSNVGMAKIGLKMGKQTLYEGLKLFGFSQRTGIDLPGEDYGLVWPVRKWSKLSVTRIPFGHEVLVTPLQICRAYSIMANGGYTVKPHIVRAVVDNQGNIIENKQPAIQTGYILKPEVAEWMIQEALTAVVNEGNSKAALDDVQVWGKTGTANIAVDGHYDWRNYVASFVGGAPAEKPAVVVLVSIRRPNRSLGKGYSGGRVAAPVVHDILENTLTYLGVINPDDDQTEEPDQI
ncbi:MAG: peptidoglycan D,D-transpeptidase FtsI family protein [Planctomycetota bacterium]